jgi:CubicO group peptidase (beta-lactamase class C family)
MSSGVGAIGLLGNELFYPGPTALAAPPFAGSIHISQVQMSFEPPLLVTMIAGRDTRLFPQLTLAFTTTGDRLVPLEWGQMVAEDPVAGVASYWCVIPQFGRVWRDAADDSGWSYAALPLMLVNDLENHCHQGLARFRYRAGQVKEFQFQFVQQTSPYLLKQHFVCWGKAQVSCEPLNTHGVRADGRRLPAYPWEALGGRVSDAFGMPLEPQWRVALALVQPDGLYFQQSLTAAGPYPYPLEMRFGVRSIMKSIAAPLALLRLAHLHGAEVLDLKVGAFVPGLDRKYDTVRFIDAANMASGFGGTGTLQTQPNDFEDGYLDADYDDWYTAPSHEAKLAHIRRSLRPYPWSPGTIPRYRDQDFYLLGAAVDGYLKSIRGPDADVWDMLCEEVFAPIGILAAPTTRTQEPGGGPGLVWFNAGYFPTLDDLAKIALLYQGRGEWGGREILHRELTAVLLSAQGALSKQYGLALPPGEMPFEALPATKPTHYRMGFHFTPYQSRRSGRRYYLPTMWGSGESEVILYPNGIASIRIGKAAGIAGQVLAHNVASQPTIEAVEALQPFD